MQLYPARTGPRFIKGHSITIAMVAFGTICFGFMSVYYYFTNKKRAEGKEDHKIVGMTDEEIEEMGDESPKFRYVI